MIILPRQARDTHRGNSETQETNRAFLQITVVRPKMQEIASKLKNVDLHNTSSHVILPNLYEATPRPGQRAPSVPHANVHRTDCTGVTTDFGCDRMAANAGTRPREKNKTSSLVPSDRSQALTPRCPLSASLPCISSPELSALCI